MLLVVEDLWCCLGFKDGLCLFLLLLLVVGSCCGCCVFCLGGLLCFGLFLLLLIFV